MRTKFINKAKIAGNIYSFVFKKPDNYRYTAGQYVELTLRHARPDQRGIKRWFTLSSSPTEPDLVISTRLFEDPSTFKAALSRLQPGAAVEISEPMGDFVLPKNPAASILFIAGGIGCTPYRSIIKYLTDAKDFRRITLLSYVEFNADQAFLDVFKTMGADFRLHFSKRPNIDEIKKYINSDLTYIYLAGPEPFVESWLKLLENNGLDRQFILTDFFHNYD